MVTGIKYVIWSVNIIKLKILGLCNNTGILVYYDTWTKNIVLRYTGLIDRARKFHYGLGISKF